MEIRKGDVVQFTESHKWCGCLGIVKEKKKIDDFDHRFMVGVPVPQQGTAYIFAVESRNEVERIGKAKLVEKE